MGQALCKCASARTGQTKEANPLHAGNPEPVVHIISKSHSDLSDLQEAEGSYGKEEIKNRPVIISVTAGAGDEPAASELLSFSPYPVTLIDIEPEHHQPIVFVNTVFLKGLGYTEEDVVGKPWTDFLKTPFGHELHSDVQSRITEAFETGCEFRETAACDTSSGDVTTLQLLFLPVCKNPDSGITHYVCIHVASQTSKRTPEQQKPIPLPNLPKWADDVPTARYVSVTMKNHTPEQLLGGTADALGIRVGSFNGMPRQPKVRRPSSLGLAAAATPPPAAAEKPEEKEKDAKKKSPSKATKQGGRKSRFAPASEDDGAQDDSPMSGVLGPGPVGNLRHDSALMGAITSQKGKMTANMASNRVPRTKEEVWLHRLRDLLTSPLEDLNKTE
ncbi:hypothetical protein WJX72_009105 [[Myrmecia] bisecta]|uniref:PAS domain-containing protein n=1 Tax=[Myrmecia] bisecta TaxID=41462 RepID=A0AAW1PR04_9CHLO